MAQEKATLQYFQFGGRAECIRLLCIAHDYPFEGTILFLENVETNMKTLALDFLTGLQSSRPLHMAVCQCWPWRAGRELFHRVMRFCDTLERRPALTQLTTTLLYVFKWISRLSQLCSLARPASTPSLMVLRRLLRWLPQVCANRTSRRRKLLESSGPTSYAPVSISYFSFFISLFFFSVF
jgi:hypothetical protein